MPGSAKRRASPGRTCPAPQSTPRHARQPIASVPVEARRSVRKRRSSSSKSRAVASRLKRAAWLAGHAVDTVSSIDINAQLEAEPARRNHPLDRQHHRGEGPEQEEGRGIADGDAPLEVPDPGLPPGEPGRRSEPRQLPAPVPQEGQGGGTASGGQDRQAPQPGSGSQGDDEKDARHQFGVTLEAPGQGRRDGALETGGDQLGRLGERTERQIGEPGSQPDDGRLRPGLPGAAKIHAPIAPTTTSRSASSSPWRRQAKFQYRARLAPSPSVR